MFKDTVKSYLYSFIDFASPRRCELCGNYLGTNRRKHEFICDDCYSNFPLPPKSKDILERIQSNFPDEKVINNSYSLFSESDNPDFMELIYSLKYRGFSRIGKELGFELGELIKRKTDVRYDYIIPVPIHHARLRERGFNQSEMICCGISNSLNIPTGFDIIKRARYTQTQTKLSAQERKKNVKDVFVAKSKKYNLSGKTILLVDDVFTTGSTLFHCAKCIIEMKAEKIDTATIVFVG
ncbi:MAG: hypothetical protein EPN82_13570 [Bacteroidetes bacterium]|nr:MAG: hypothetical protein EPN82_13570 [Bacteroidota bacterium]